jgi:hypothetical protein
MGFGIGPERARCSRETLVFAEPRSQTHARLLRKDCHKVLTYGIDICCPLSNGIFLRGLEGLMLNASFISTVLLSGTRISHLPLSIHLLSNANLCCLWSWLCENSATIAIAPGINHSRIMAKAEVFRKVQGLP